MPDRNVNLEVREGWSADRKYVLTSLERIEQIQKGMASDVRELQTMEAIMKLWVAEVSVLRLESRGLEVRVGEMDKRLVVAEMQLKSQADNVKAIDEAVKDMSDKLLKQSVKVGLIGTIASSVLTGIVLKYFNL